MAKRVTCRCALYFNCARLPNTYVGMDARIVLAVIAILTLYKGKVRYVMADISRRIYSAGYVYSGKRHATVRRPSVCTSVHLSACLLVVTLTWLIERMTCGLPWDSSHHLQTRWHHPRTCWMFLSSLKFSLVISLVLRSI